jgi:U3 small nucleolar RNA-associated protein 7
VCNVQEDLVKELDTISARKVFDLTLNELGPYNMTYTRNGKHMLLGGAKGHLAIMEWSRAHLVTEIQVR